MTVIAINTGKGGVGKSTTATNLAGVMALEGHKVLIIDGDYQGNVALSFGINPDMFESTLYDVLVDGLPPDKAIVNVFPNIDILPSNNDLIGFDFKVIGDRETFPAPFELLKNTCSHLKDNYDHIIIDCPPSQSLMVANVFLYSDSVLIPFVAEAFSMRALVKVLENIEEFSSELNPSLSILGVLPSMYNSRTKLHKEVLKQTQKYCEGKDIKVFKSIIPHSIRLASSVGYDKLPIVLTRGNKDMVKLYKQLWEELQL